MGSLEVTFRLGGQKEGVLRQCCPLQCRLWCPVEKPFSKIKGNGTFWWWGMMAQRKRLGQKGHKSGFVQWTKYWQWTRHWIYWKRIPYLHNCNEPLIATSSQIYFRKFGKIIWCQFYCTGVKGMALQRRMQLWQGKLRKLAYVALLALKLNRGTLKAFAISSALAFIISGVIGHWFIHCSFINSTREFSSSQKCLCSGPVKPCMKIWLCFVYANCAPMSLRYPVCTIMLSSLNVGKY